MFCLWLLTTCGCITVVLCVNSDDSFMENPNSLCNASASMICTPSSVEHHQLTSIPPEIMSILQFSSKENATKYRFCFPEKKYLEIRQNRAKFKVMAHVMCRQLGHMTYVGSRGGSSLESAAYKYIWPTAVCSGTEQLLQDCNWPEVIEVECKKFLLVKCGSCSNEFSGIHEGEITTPGYPAAFFPMVQCEWKIPINFGEAVELRFTKFTLPEIPERKAYCPVENAYIELKTYPKQEDGEISSISDADRYCIGRNPAGIVKVKAKTVVIHFSSGLFPAETETYPIGVRIQYKIMASPKIESSMQTLAITLSTCVGMFIIIFLMYHLYKCLSVNGPRISLKACKTCCETPSEIHLREAEMYEDVARAPRPPPKSVSVYQHASKKLHERQASMGVSFASFPTPRPLGQTRQLCTSDGQCQYILCHEVESHELELERARRTKSLQAAASAMSKNIYVERNHSRESKESQDQSETEELVNPRATSVLTKSEMELHQRCGQRLQTCLKASTDTIESGYPATICCSMPSECVELFKNSPEITLSQATSSEERSKKKLRLKRADATSRTPPDISIVDISQRKISVAKSL